MREKGFTLIELLVVIAIIAILAALLFPLFIHVKMAAQTSQCLSNCKQIAAGLSIYKDDNGGHWPSCYWQGDHHTAPSGGGANPSWTHAFWMRALMPYVKSTGVYRCPAANPAYPFADYAGTMSGDVTALKNAGFTAANYGMNEQLIESIWSSTAGVPDLTRESNISYPSSTALVADCNAVTFWGGQTNGYGTSTGTGPDGVVYPDGMLRIKYPNTQPTSSTWLAKNARHSGRSCVVFADLHVKALAATEFRVNLTSNPVRMFPVIWPLAKPM